MQENKTVVVDKELFERPVPREKKVDRKDDEREKHSDYMATGTLHSKVLASRKRLQVKKDREMSMKTEKSHSVSNQFFAHLLSWKTNISEKVCLEEYL